MKSSIFYAMLFIASALNAMETTSSADKSNVLAVHTLTNIITTEKIESDKTKDLSQANLEKKIRNAFQKADSSTVKVGAQQAQQAFFIETEEYRKALCIRYAIQNIIVPWGHPSKKKVYSTESGTEIKKTKDGYVIGAALPNSKMSLKID